MQTQQSQPGPSPGMVPNKQAPTRLARSVTAGALLLTLAGCATPDPTAAARPCAATSETVAAETLGQTDRTVQRVIGRTQTDTSIAWAFASDGSAYSTAVTDCPTGTSSSLGITETATELDQATLNAAQACELTPDPKHTHLLQVHKTLLLVDTRTPQTACPITIDGNGTAQRIGTQPDEPLRSMLPLCVELLTQPGPVIVTAPRLTPEPNNRKIVLQMDQPDGAHHCQITYTAEPQATLLHE